MVVGEDDSKDCKLKPMRCEMNYLNKSDGSALLAQGDTVALVSVNGPLDIKMSSQSIEKATLEVIFSGKSGRPAVADRYKEHVIKQNCETAILSSVYPRSGITVSVQALEDFGGLLACAVNCCCLALLNTGVMMRSTFAAVSCAVDETGNILLEPVGEDLEKARAVMSFVFDSRDKSLVSGFTDGSYSEDAYREALERCRAASDLIFAFYRDILLACAVNCCCLALLNTGVMMRSTFAAVSCAVDETGNILLEPVGEDLEKARAVMSFVFDSRDKSLVSGFTDGSYSEDAYREALERCRAASDLIFAFYRDIVRKYSYVI